MIGVPDRVGEPPIGLEPDYLLLRKDGKADADLFRLALHQAVTNAVGPAAATNVSSEIHSIDGIDVCRVHVFPSSHPVRATVTSIDGNGQHQRKQRFYVRMGNGTREVTDESEIEKYIAGRWGG